MLLPSLRLTEVPLLTDSMSLFAWSDKLARRFSLSTRFAEPYAMFSRRGDCIELPREVAPVGQQDNRTKGICTQVQMLRNPRDAEQARVVQEMSDLLAQQESFILCSPTASGKTFMGSTAISVVGRKTLVIVPKEDLMDQWRERLQLFTDLKAHDIGIIQADKVSTIGKKVVLGMLHSVALQDRYPEGTFDDFGLVIADEVHRCAADQLSKCFRNLPAQLRLGLSATPKRADGKEQLLYAHVGPIRVEGVPLTLVPKVLAFASSWKVPRVTSRDPITGTIRVIKLPHNAGKVGHILKYLAKHAERNVMISRLAVMAYAKGRNIVIFSDLLEHLAILRRELIRQEIPDYAIAMYVGGLTEQAREAAIGCRIILATYGFFREGTDVPWLDTAIFATPRADVVQAAGRILREYPDKKEPLLIDIVDADSGVFCGYWEKRLRFYRSIGAVVKEQ